MIGLLVLGFLLGVVAVHGFSSDLADGLEVLDAFLQGTSE